MKFYDVSNKSGAGMWVLAFLFTVGILVMVS